MSEKCSGCGGDGPTTVHLVVPEEAGGRASLSSNRVYLCPTCLFAQGIPGAKLKRDRPACIHIGRSLHDSLQISLKAPGGYKSLSGLMNALVRFKVDQGDIPELEFFQDSGERDVRVTVWVPDDVYHKFKLSAVEDRTTVTGRLIGLLMWYLERVNRRIPLNDMRAEVPSERVAL